MKSSYLVLALASMLSAMAPTKAEEREDAIDVLRIACSAPVALCDWLAVQSPELTGVSVDVVYANAHQVLGWMAEDQAHNRARFDLWWGAGSSMVMSALQQGRLRPLPSTEQPQQLRWSRQLWETSGQHLAGLYTGSLVLVTNPVAMRPDSLPAPRCWTDLADSAYQNQILWAPPEQSELTQRALDTIRGVHEPAQAERLIRQIRANIGNAVIKTESALMDVILGHRAMTIAMAHEAIPFYSFYSPLITTPPCEGSGYIIAAAAIPRYSLQPELATAFVDFTLSVEFQNAVVNKVSGAIFSHPEATPSRIYQDRRLLNVTPLDPLATQQRPVW